jgi:steroid 5-alpha reductase family enzyme
MDFNNGRWFIYGLVSYVTIETNSKREKRCLPKYPSYSTKISAYYPWIQSKINI